MTGGMSRPPAPSRRADSIPDGPPPQVMDAIALAAAVYERMAADGREVRFETDPNSGRLVISLRDARGAALAHLSACDVVDLAAGAAPLLARWADATSC